MSAQTLSGKADEERVAAPSADERPVPRPPRRWGALGSPLTRRILLLNFIALVIPVLGLLYLEDYRDSLIASELEAMRTQGQVFSLSLGATSVVTDQNGNERLVPELTRHQVRLLLKETGLRARLFGPLEEGGSLLIDSFALDGPDGAIEVKPLLPVEEPSFTERLLAFLETAFLWLPGDDPLPYVEVVGATAADYDEVMTALAGRTAGELRQASDGSLVLMTAVPVQRYRQVLGAILLTKSGDGIAEAVGKRRLDVLVVFAVAFSITVLLSFYLAGSIAKPVRQLAQAALLVKSGKGKKIELPDFGRRRDEIGDLGRALKEMTDAMWLRLNAIEGFAADVAHEIKNPLTSLRSAVETVARVEDPVQQKKLMAIILEDVGRLDRLITDISEASRIDAELARAESEPVDVRRLLEALVEVQKAGAKEDGPRFELAMAASPDLQVMGLEGRLGQVFRNLIVNAVSFSPEGGMIRLIATRLSDSVEIAVEDEGPGIPEGKFQAIFDRFYSERPEGEKFGQHSGLGLSISKQIVEAHRGRIWAENRLSANGQVEGARFVVSLPAPPRSAQSRTRGFHTRSRRS